MKRFQVLFILVAIAMVTAGCNVRVFISDTRMRGPVPPPEVLAARASTATAAAANATPTPSAQESVRIGDVIDDLEGRVGEDLAAEFTFSGRETPRAARPARGMRIEPGDTIRISAGRSQEVAIEADEHCVGADQQRCSRVWVHGRPGGGSQGAWYPIVVFEYDLE